MNERRKAGREGGEVGWRKVVITMLGFVTDKMSAYVCLVFCHMCLVFCHMCLVFCHMGLFSVTGVCFLSHVPCFLSLIFVF